MSKENLLIIGASSDLALGLVRTLGANTRVIAHYNRTKEDIEKVAKTSGVEVHFKKADLRNEKETVLMIEEVEEEFGVPQMILHVAAPPYRFVRTKDATWETYQIEIDIGVRTLFLLASRFFPKAKKGDGIRMVTVLSSLTLQNSPPVAVSHYVTAKYAQLGMVKSLASEFAGKKVSLNAVSPSMMETKFLDGIPEKMKEIAAERHPQKRNASVDDVIPTINFLLSKDAAYITGTNVPITGMWG